MKLRLVGDADEPCVTAAGDVTTWFTAVALTLRACGGFTVWVIVNGVRTPVDETGQGAGVPVAPVGTVTEMSFKVTPPPAYAAPRICSPSVVAARTSFASGTESPCG